MRNGLEEKVANEEEEIVVTNTIATNTASPSTSDESYYLSNLNRILKMLFFHKQLEVARTIHGKTGNDRGQMTLAKIMHLMNPPIKLPNCSEEETVEYLKLLARAQIVYYSDNEKAYVFL
jgi:hypothetical protein